MIRPFETPSENAPRRHDTQPLSTEELYAAHRRADQHPPAKPPTRGWAANTRARLLSGLLAFGGTALQTEPTNDGQYWATHTPAKPHEPEMETGHGESLKGRMARPGFVGSLAQAEERRDHVWNGYLKRADPHGDAPETATPATIQALESSFSPELEDVLIRHVTLEAGQLLKDEMLPTKIRDPESMRQLEIALDTAINRALRASRQELNELDRKEGGLFLADLFAVHIFAKTVHDFTLAHPERTVPAADLFDALLDRVANARFYVAHSQSNERPSPDVLRETNEAYAAIRCLQFETITNDAERLSYIGEYSGAFSERAYAAIEAGLPWLIAHRDAIRADEHAAYNVVNALNVAAARASDPRTRQAQLALLRYLERDAAR